EGHGAYNSGDKCVQQAVNSYLLDGKVPAADTVCTASQNPSGTPVAPEPPPQGA
ncbi:alpha/beta hydrolase, partial [Streptomyces sp. A1547]